jgi:adenylate cyclase
MASVNLRKRPAPIILQHQATEIVAMSILDELKRRNTIRVAALYLVASWLVLQVADILFGAFDLPSWSIRLLVAILILGFPVVLIFSWVFEITPDGIKREADINRNAETLPTGRKVNILIMVLVVLSGGIVVLDRVIPESSPVDLSTSNASSDASMRSIAVLPFVNFSDDPANVYFSEGLSEELLNMLAAIPELQVTARTSSFSFKDKDLDVPTIGRSLNVANVLEGSVRKSGDQLRITAQLINVENGFHLWSETYDRNMDDIFAVQDEIANAVVGALRVSILGETPRARETDPEAFAAYLYALHHYQQRTNDGYEQAVKYAQQAVEIDPDYAPAWNLLGATYSNQAINGQLPFNEAHELSLLANEKALEIDPNFALAYSARAWVAMRYERDYAASARYFQQALALAPDNPIIMGNAAVLASTLGRIDEAIDLQRRSLALNPISTVGHSNLSDQLARAGRPADAIDAARLAIELAPANASARVNLAAAYLLSNQPEKAIDEVGKANYALYKLFIESIAYELLARTDESIEAVTRMTELYSNDHAFLIAGVYASRNDVETAFEWLYRAVSDGQSTSGIRSDPFLNNLHGDPRWNPLLARLGLSDEQIVAIEF